MVKKSIMNGFKKSLCLKYHAHKTVSVLFHKQMTGRNGWLDLYVTPAQRLVETLYDNDKFNVRVTLSRRNWHSK